MNRYEQNYQHRAIASYINSAFAMHDSFCTEKLNPSIEHFCFCCKKMMINTVRVVAKIKQEMQQQRYINLCPPCLTTFSDRCSISEYMVCDKVNKPLRVFNNLTGEQVLSSLQTLKEEGIEQMDSFRQNQDPKNLQKQVYQQLNAHIFTPNKLAYKTNSEPTPLANREIQQNRLKQKNPLNRKHLKALGYSWERNEFEYQPESIFGLLIGSLEKNEQNEQDYDELSEVLYKYYRQQQTVFQEVKDYLVNTLFLLGRKGLHQMEGVPPCIAELRNCEDQIKKIIASIYDITGGRIVMDEQQQKVKEEGRREDKEKIKKQSEQSKEDQQERQRSRDIKKKKHKHRSKSEESDHHKSEKKRRRRRRHQQKDERHSKRSDLNRKEPYTKQQPLSAQYKDNRAEYSRQSTPFPLKRGRGRPKGSLGKRKLTNDGTDSQYEAKKRRIILKKSEFAHKGQKQLILQGEDNNRQTKLQKNDSHQDSREPANEEDKESRSRSTGRGRGRGRWHQADGRSQESKSKQKKIGRPRKSIYVNPKESGDFVVQFDSD